MNSYYIITLILIIHIINICNFDNKRFYFYPKRIKLILSKDEVYKVIKVMLYEMEFCLILASNYSLYLHYGRIFEVVNNIDNKQLLTNLLLILLIVVILVKSHFKLSKKFK